MPRLENDDLARGVRDLRRLRILLIGFALGLVVSGVTAFPLPPEVAQVCRWLGAADTAAPTSYSGLLYWLATVRDALRATSATYPFLFYGYDWMAFAHLVIALPSSDPSRIRFGTNGSCNGCWSAARS